MGIKERKRGKKMENETAEIRLVEKENWDYPERLRELSDAPDKLYVLGKLPGEQAPSVAVIGARDCSEYGKYMASRLGNLFGRNGIQVISGMARGIDGIAQEAAVDAGGSSFAVLGSGVDICYPARNRRLYEKLKKGGGILSEYPPKTPALPQNFPPRNRIVSGLADAVVVVEARQKSGTLITVDMALEQGKEVYAVPGRVTDGLSAGCNRLLKLGAGIVLDTEDLLEELRDIFERRCPTDGIFGRKQRENAVSGKLSEREKKLLADSPELEEIYRLLDFSPQSAEQLGEQLSKKYGNKQIITHLLRLCVEKLAVQVSPGRFCVRKD